MLNNCDMADPKISRPGLLKVQVVAAVLLLLTLLSGCGSVNLENDLDKVTQETADYVMEQTPVIASGSIGGEWALLGLEKSGVKVEQAVKDDYLKQLELTVKKKQGVLSEDKFTEYARVSIGILACGKQPTEFVGYNLVKPLDNFKGVEEQGVNAMDFALIASKMAGVKLENQQRYIDYIVKTINDGTYDNDEYASDYLAMHVEALSLYSEDKVVKDAISKALKGISKRQKDDGSMGNCDSTCEAIIALCQAGVDVFNDEDFIKDGKSLADGMMKFRLKDNSFVHVLDEKSANGMATEKALMALDAMKLAKDGKRLYE